MENGKNKHWKETEYNLFEYFWASSIFSPKDENNLPFFLKKIDIFRDFSELEVFELIQYIHLRNFSAGEVIVAKDECGIGFYIMITGAAEVKNANNLQSETAELHSKMYFGEKNLLLEKSKSSVSITAKEPCVLAAILTPDLDNLIDKKPRVAVKFIKALSKISLRRYAEVERSLFNQSSGN